MPLRDEESKSDSSLDHGTKAVASSSNFVEAVESHRDVPDANGEWVALEGWRLAAGLATVFFGFLLSVIESTITATALVSIGDHFNDQIRAQWVVIAYLLAYMSFAVIFARLSDGIGGKNALLIAWVMFCAFSLGGGLAQSLNLLIAFRCLQGIGGSGIYSLTFVVGVRFTPPKYFGAFSGCAGIAYAIGSILGPILGGVITQTSTWRWIYLFNGPCLLVAVAGIMLFIPSRPKSVRAGGLRIAERLRRMKRLDFLGAFLLVAGSTLLVFSLQEAGSSTWAWDSAIVICALVFAAFCWTGFFAWTGWLTYRKASKNGMKPILPLSLILSRPTGPGLGVVLLASFPYYIAVIHLPQRFQLVNGNGPILAGVHLLPLLGAVALGSALGAGLSRKKNITAETTIASTGLTLLGCGLFTTISDSRSIDKAVYGYQVILGLGVGIAFSAVLMMVNINNKREDNAAVQGAVSQARMLGGAVGLSVATIVFNSRLVSKLSDRLSPPQLSDIQRSLATISSLPPSLRTEVVNVYATSFNQQMRVCTYVSAVCFVVSLATWQRHPVGLDYLQPSKTSAQKTLPKDDQSASVEPRGFWKLGKLEEMRKGS